MHFVILVECWVSWLFFKSLQFTKTIEAWNILFPVDLNLKINYLLKNSFCLFITLHKISQSYSICFEKAIFEAHALSFQLKANIFIFPIKIVPLLIKHLNHAKLEMSRVKTLVKIEHINIWFPKFLSSWP